MTEVQVRIEPLGLGSATDREIWAYAGEHDWDRYETQWYHILYQSEEEPTMAITASEARKNLFPLIEQVNEDHVAIEITSKRGGAMLMSVDDYRALEETAYLLRVPANLRRLIESLDQARAGDLEEHPLHG